MRELGELVQVISDAPDFDAQRADGAGIAGARRWRKTMPRQKPTDKIESIQKAQRELAAKLREAQTKARNEVRETERRKAELAGAVALKELEANPSGPFAGSLRELLHTGITKKADRALFDLPALPKVEAEAGGSSVGGG
jgi:hypothetical protein